MRFIESGRQYCRSDGVLSDSFHKDWRRADSGHMAGWLPWFFVCVQCDAGEEKRSRDCVQAFAHRFTLTGQKEEHGLAPGPLTGDRTCLERTTSLKVEGRRSKVEGRECKFCSRVKGYFRKTISTEQLHSQLLIGEIFNSAAPMRTHSRFCPF